MKNHRLKVEGDNLWRCEDCLIAWSFLSGRDIAMLEASKHCLGQEKRWHRCAVAKGMWCLGAKPGHEACVGLSSSEDMTEG